MGPRSKKSPAPARKKACEQCAASKVRCDLARPSCARCSSRSIRCRYSASAAAPAGSESGQQTHQLNTPEQDALPDASYSSAMLGRFAQSSTPDSRAFASGNIALLSPVSDSRSYADARRTGDIEAEAALNFENLELVPTIDSVTVRNRWMESIVPSDDQVPKSLPRYTLLFLSSVLKTYPKLMVQPDGLPPIIHPLQIINGRPAIPIANCYSLVRMWYGQVDGSEAIVTATIQQEMNRLLEEHLSYDQFTLLAAFQSFLIYVLMAYFSPATASESVLVTRLTVIQLQELASAVVGSGLVCASELSHSRPPWESWIIASAKRRAIYAFYLFNTVYNELSGLPSYVAEELRGLPVPAGRTLWESRVRRHWEREYDRQLASWDEKGELQISELWFSPETGTSERRQRIEQWVQEADEFGMLLFAVCVHIHGL